MTADLILLSAKLLDIRDTYRRLIEAGHEKWPHPNALRMMASIRDVAEGLGKAPLDVAVMAAKKAEDAGEPTAALAILACACEIIDPTKETP